MLISYNWIKEFAKVNETAEGLAKKLTMAGIEVSSVVKEKNDYIYDAEITPNRPDLLSIIGIAREGACITRSKFIPPKIEPFKKNIGADIDVQIKASSACLRYNATLIKNTEVKVSSHKITCRLNSLNIRSVNNIVDITNYCLLETGQPLHAFDYDKIKGRKIIVRWAKKNESIHAIDGSEYKLDESILVIADEERPIAIAGIMGSVDTEIGPETKNLLLECAHFDPLTIRRASRKLGLSSDSSYRFERGVCLDDIPGVAQKTSSLIVQSTGSEITNNIDICKKKTENKFATLRRDELMRILGFNIPLEEVRRILTDLGFKIKSSKKGKIIVRIPPFRQDISREADLIEEVARIYGYNRIPDTLAKVSPKQIQRYRSSPKVTEAFKYKAKQAATNILISVGLNEVINYSLVNERDVKSLGFDSEKVVWIKNPLSNEQGLMRPTLILGMLNTVMWNLNRQIDDVSIFETGKTFYKKNKKIHEGEKIGICLCGNKFAGNWQIEPKAFNFFDLKGIIERLLTALGISNYKFNHFEDNLFIRKHSAKVTLGNQDIAIAGKVRKDILDIFDIETNVYVAEIDFEKILPYLKMEPKVKPIPKFPHIVRDLAVIVKGNLESKTVVEQIEKIGKPLVKEVTLFDIYTGRQIPPGYKSLAYSIKYQSQERTLTDEEIDEIQEEIQRALVENLKAQIR